MTLPNDHRISILLWQLVLIRPMDHELVPKHRKVTTKEERATLGPSSNLPALRSDDVIAQYLGLRNTVIVVDHQWP